MLPWSLACEAKCAITVAAAWPVSLEPRVRGEIAEGRAIDPDRMREVSRRHSRRIETGT